MTDSEDSDNFDPRSLQEVHQEIEKYKKDPELSSMFVSGWDDDDQGIESVKDPKANPVDHVLWAAENGNVEVLKELLTSSPSLVHVHDADGYTPLHRAAYGNHVTAISYLLSMGAKVDKQTQLSWTPLHSACKWNNFKAVARLLAAGADPKALSEGAQTPLHIASSISHCKSTLLVLLLREDVANVARSKNKSGETPEDLARGKGIYGPLFEMVIPSASYIKNMGFTCNPFLRASL